MEATLIFSKAFGEPDPPEVKSTDTSDYLSVVKLETRNQTFRVTEMPDGSLRLEAWAPIKIRPEAANLVVVEYALDNV